MKKILFPIAVASALSIATLGALQGLAQDEAAQEGATKAADAVENKEAEKKEEPAKVADEKVAEDAKQPAADTSVAQEGFLEKFSDKVAEEIAKGVLAPDAAERVAKLMSRGKELRTGFTEKIKALREESEKPGLSDQRVREIASDLPAFEREIATLDQRFYNFFHNLKRDASKLTTLQRREWVASLSYGVELAADRLEGRISGRRAAPPPGSRPRTGSLPTDANLLQTQGANTLEQLPEDEAKAFAVEWFPDKFSQRVQSLVSRGKELQARFIEKIKELDTEAAKPGLDDARIRNLASDVTNLKEASRMLNREFFSFFYQPGLRNEDMQSLARRLARVTTLSEAVEAAEIQLGLRAPPAGPDAAAPPAQTNVAGSSGKAEEGKSEPPKPGEDGKKGVAEQKEQKEGEDAGRAGGQKFVDTLQPPLNSSHLEVMTEEATKKFAEKTFPANVAERVVKLVLRGKELDALFGKKVQELDAAAAKPDVSDVQVRGLASEITNLKGYARRLNQAVVQFLSQADTAAFPAPSMANRIASVADLNSAVESAEIQLGLRPGPASRTGSSNPFGRGGSSRSGPGGTFGGPPTRVDLLKSMSDEEVKAYLQARFPAAAMERIGKVVAQARELIKTLDEKIAKIDADLVDEKLTDEQIESMVMLARTYRSTKDNLAREFDNISMSNLAMQSMSEAVSWLPQLSRAVKQAETNIEAIDNEARSAKTGIKSSDLEEIYRQAKALHSRYQGGMRTVKATLEDPNAPPQQRAAVEAEYKALQVSILKLERAIGFYEAKPPSPNAIPSERLIAAVNVMREALVAPGALSGAGEGGAASPADPMAAHRKLADRAASLRTAIADLLRSLTARLADPNIASAELDRLSSRVAELQNADKELRDPVMGYWNSIANKPDPDRTMVVNNVVLLQHAIREAEKVVGPTSTISVASDARHPDVASATEGSGASSVVGEEASEIGPLGKRLIAACESLKTQLEVRLKEVDEKLNAPDVTLEQIEELARLKSQLEEAIRYCDTTRENSRNSGYTTSSNVAHVAGRLRTTAANLLPAKPMSGAMGPQPNIAGMPMGSMGGPGMPGGSMPGGMMPVISGAMPGMMPGMLPGSTAPPSPFQAVEELRQLYKKHFDEKDEQGVTEIKDKIAKELAKIFDAQQAARETQLTTAREKLKKLEQQQARRTATRDELIESRTKQIIQELEGTAWTDDPEVPW